MATKKKAEKTYFDDYNVKEALEFCPEPTITFEIGENVVIGNLKNPIITDKYEDGKVYKIKYTRVDNNYGNPTESEGIGFWMWYEIGTTTANEDHNLIKNEDFRLDYSQRCLNGLLTMVYHFGLDTSPEYQREYVWSDEDKVALIDSIFHNVDIGKFTFVHMGYENKYGYEIMDGKQRLKAITDFYENRFSYKGLYFKDLSNHEKFHFTNYSVSYAELRDTTKENKYKTFILLNTAGKPVDVAQIDKVKEMYRSSTGKDLE